MGETLSLPLSPPHTLSPISNLLPLTSKWNWLEDDDCETMPELDESTGAAAGAPAAPGWPADGVAIGAPGPADGEMAPGWCAAANVGMIT